MTKLCGCGCGQPTPIAKRASRTGSYAKGEPADFIQNHHLRRGVFARASERPDIRKADRFRVDDRGYETPCHTWLLFKDSGYGITWDPVTRRRRPAHAVAYEAVYGPIPNGLEIDHLCSNRDCVNPDHLEAVPHAENIRRTVARGLHRSPERCRACGRYLSNGKCKNSRHGAALHAGVE